MFQQDGFLYFPKDFNKENVPVPVYEKIYDKSKRVELKVSSLSHDKKMFNQRTGLIEESIHVQFNELTPNSSKLEPSWLFDLDGLFSIFTSSDESSSSSNDLVDNDDYRVEISRSFIDPISIVPTYPEVSESISSQSADVLAEENVSPVSSAAS
ncbi:hypothetical protein L1987_13590 [Smallanthus sonchifolius]|uniref:Uncharacterized protein n=1 Tax=Smallanthus sonchifolius TaxID=185202 RepID=A0ACB9JHB9_9ASTR|nr:hypothetical protein L1987_13590 [Smallanthus sonchifolius]